MKGYKKALQLMKLYRSGELKTLKSPFEKLNKSLMNGIDWNRIFTIAGLSGTGKSMILKQIVDGFYELNTDQEFDTLMFEFEMLPEDTALRSISAKLGYSTKELLSKDELVPEAVIARAEEFVESIANRTITSYDTPLTPEKLISTIKGYCIDNELFENNRGLVVTLDHLLLLKGDDAKKKIDKFMELLVELKVWIADQGGRAIFILLSQLNREIEDIDRIRDSSLHYPTRSDIFGSSTIYQSSDYVMITHKPSGVVGIRAYGPLKLPIMREELPILYWHIIKERFGETPVLSMVADFARSNIQDLWPHS